MEIEPRPGGREGTSHDGKSLEEVGFFWVEGTTHAKVLGQHHDWQVGGTMRKPMWLKQSERDSGRGWGSSGRALWPGRTWVFTPRDLKTPGGRAVGTRGQELTWCSQAPSSACCGEDAVG